MGRKLISACAMAVGAPTVFRNKIAVYVYILIADFPLFFLIFVALFNPFASIILNTSYLKEY